jgi:hypothetical protein
MTTIDMLGGVLKCDAQLCLSGGVESVREDDTGIVLY